jgi:hypothetical protein
LLENVHAMARARADHMNSHVRCNPVDLARRPNNIIPKIRLVDHDHRSGTTLLNQGKIKLHARQIVVTARGHNEDDIDIRCQKLGVRLPRCFAD